jgi:hypothetical protein
MKNISKPLQKLISLGVINDNKLLNINRIAPYYPTASMYADKEYLIRKFKTMAKEYKYAYTCTEALEKYVQAWEQIPIDKYKNIWRKDENGKKTKNRVLKTKEELLINNPNNNKYKCDVWVFTNLEPDVEVEYSVNDYYIDLQPNFNNKTKLLLCLDDMRKAGLKKESVYDNLEDLINSYNGINENKEKNKVDIDSLMAYSPPDTLYMLKTNYDFYKKRIYKLYPLLNDKKEYFEDLIKNNTSKESPKFDELHKAMDELRLKDKKLSNNLNYYEYKEPIYDLPTIEQQDIDDLKMRYILYNKEYSNNINFYKTNITMDLDDDLIWNNYDYTEDDFLYRKSTRSRIQDRFWVESENEYNNIKYTFNNYMEVYQDIKNLNEAKETNDKELIYLEQKFITKYKIDPNQRQIDFPMPNLFTLTKSITNFDPISEYDFNYKELYNKFRNRFSKYKTQQIMKKYKTILNGIKQMIPDYTYIMKNSPCLYEFKHLDTENKFLQFSSEIDFLQFFELEFEIDLDDCIPNWKDMVKHTFEEIYNFYDTELIDLDPGNLSILEQIECILIMELYDMHHNY